MRRRPPRSTPLYSSAASDVYKRQKGDGVAGTRTDQRLIELGNHSPTTHFIDKILGAEILIADRGAVSAVRLVDIVGSLGTCPRDVHRDLVTLLHRTLHFGELARGGAKPVNLSGDLFVGNVQSRDRHHQTLVSRDGHGGSHFDNGIEGHGP